MTQRGTHGLEQTPVLLRHLDRLRLLDQALRRQRRPCPQRHHREQLWESEPLSLFGRVSRRHVDREEGPGLGTLG